MKKVIVIPLLIICSATFAQGYFFGLTSNSYLETKYNSDKDVRVKKSIYIIYNKEFCTFFLEGKGTFSFKTRDYQKKMQGSYLHTDFISQETNTTPDGYYGVMIDENKDGVMFQVSLANGSLYLVEKAKKYSENGKVNGNIQVVTQKKEYEKNINWIAERKKYWDTVSNINFKENPTLKEKHLICKTNISDYISGKLSFHTTKTNAEPFYIVHIFFNVDTSGKIFLQGRTLTERYPKTSIIEDLSGIDIDKKVKEIFVLIPWEFEKDFNGRQKEIFNCEVTVNLEAKPSASK